MVKYSNTKSFLLSCCWTRKILSCTAAGRAIWLKTVKERHPLNQIYIFLSVIVVLSSSSYLISFLFWFWGFAPELLAHSVQHCKTHRMRPARSWMEHLHRLFGESTFSSLTLRLQEYRFRLLIYLNVSCFSYGIAVGRSIKRLARSEAYLGPRLKLDYHVSLN